MERKTSAAVKGFVLYRIYYKAVDGKEYIAYVGRTKQSLATRIRGHLFAKPMHRSIHIEQVSKIEYAKLQSEADMNLYEIYYILKNKPPLNVDDKARDTLSVELPELTWTPYAPPLWKKWSEELAWLETSYVKKQRRLYRDIPQDMSILRSKLLTGEIDRATYDCEHDRLQAERIALRMELSGTTSKI